MKSPKELQLPVGTSPLATQVGRLMKTYRASRKWSIAQAAASLGISPGHYKYTETGRVIPGPKLARRLRAWIVDKISFEGASPFTERNWRNAGEARAWRMVKAALPLEKALLLKKQAQILHMGIRDLAGVYIQLGLESKMAFAQLSQAIEATNEARALNALAESPELRDLLTVEHDVLTAAVEPTPWTAVDAFRPELEKLANVKLDLGTLSVKEVEDEIEDL